MTLFGSGAVHSAAAGSAKARAKEGEEGERTSEKPRTKDDRANPIPEPGTVLAAEKTPEPNKPKEREEPTKALDHLPRSDAKERQEANKTLKRQTKSKAEIHEEIIDKEKPEPGSHVEDVKNRPHPQEVVQKTSHGHSHGHSPGSAGTAGSLDRSGAGGTRGSGGARSMD
jgi:hypothetical protein